ncbi:DNA-formamidopyrimidine glycosylase [Psychrobacter sp. YP14]|uniref:bifunctional DNA-formamidopyrimidine glycosylase/DNA-(apurinic or apyrimidinic site) lyase n=1 Tax=Psychrobacter sp. YP14 TaxID=2203895 RepID=UPI000D7D8442|nr:bifunctional DNA-formamidopyrimidine glycosylase/DNA-(apurinic or apyrimidinic site) lyase [Psychrobacter sp. YP14]AWT48417.1 DNA-formamidopyrimidine glycosylase [Psychrobacter sp. YP14]
MPELPEVETTKTSLKPLLKKQVAQVDVYQPKLRWPVPDDIHRLQGYTLQQVERRAKYLILQFQRLPSQSGAKTANMPDTKSIIIHLGMSGSLQQFQVGTDKRKHDHLIMQYKADDTEPAIQLHYHDPRRFGAILWFDDYAEKLFDHLGIEPLDDQFSGDYLFDKIHRVAENAIRSCHNKPLLKPISRPIKAVIMDQEVVVGVGNIYATESLFLSGIHPITPADQLSKVQLAELVKYIKEILKQSITQGGSTLKDFTVASGTTGYFQQTLLVYGKYKSPCPTCGAGIDKIVITGRASTFCPTCQPEPS